MWLWVAYSLDIESSESHADVIDMCSELPLGLHYIIMITNLLAAMREFGTHHCPKCEIPNLFI